MSDVEKTQKFDLTLNIVSTLELARVIRELEKLDDFLHQANLRSGGQPNTMPKTTRSLETVAEANKRSLLNAEDRSQLLADLKELKIKAKKVHISFAVEPSPVVLQKIAAWLRQHVEDNLLVDVGVQPTISVGCIVRTTNKVFDMSLRNRFKEKRPLLAELLEKAS